MRAAVIGCGDVSVVHLEALAKLSGVTLAAVCDTDPVRAGAAAERWAAPAFADHRKMLDAARPDVVHVCTPHNRHVDTAIDCLRAGVAVLVEKPVANTVAEASRLIAAAAEHPHVRAGICLQNRYNAASRAAHDLLASGELGAVLGASATVMWHRDPAYYRSRPWRGRRSESGGGVLINQAIHTLDLLDWLLGEVVGIRGHAGRAFLDAVIDVEDTAHAVLDHAGGARSVFFATVANVVDAPVTIEIATERATLRIRGDLTVSYQDGRTATVAEPPAATGGRPYWGASHELLIADFYNTVHDPGPFWIDPAAGCRSLRVVHGIYQAST